MARERRPLAGRRVLVTRAEAQAQPLVDLLREQGADVIAIPTIAIELLNPSPGLDRCLGRLAEYQWLILTSANGVAALGGRMRELGIPAGAFAHMQCVAVGAATADAMRGLGLRADIIPDAYVAEAVVSAIKDEVAGKNILLVRGTLARDVIPVALEEAGAWVDIADAYKTVVPRTSVEKMQEAFASSKPPEIVTFTSSSTVDNFVQLLDEAGLTELRASLQAASIGPITSQTLRGYGWEPWVEASLHSVTGLVEAMQHKRLRAGVAQYIARRVWILVPLLLAASIGGVWGMHALFKATQR